jgi:hypothetical protein
MDLAILLKLKNFKNCDFDDLLEIFLNFCEFIFDSSWLHEVISLLSIPARFVPSEEPDMVSFDKDGIFVDVSVSPFSFSLV